MPLREAFSTPYVAHPLIHARGLPAELNRTLTHIACSLSNCPLLFPTIQQRLDANLAQTPYRTL